MRVTIETSGTLWAVVHKHNGSVAWFYPRAFGYDSPALAESSHAMIYGTRKDAIRMRGSMRHLKVVKLVP